MTVNLYRLRVNYFFIEIAVMKAGPNLQSQPSVNAFEVNRLRRQVRKNFPGASGCEANDHFRLSRPEGPCRGLEKIQHSRLIVGGR